MGHGELDALERVADVEEAAGLPALAVDGERVTDHRLHAEAVQDRAEVLVVVEAGDQPLVPGGLLGLDPVDHSLVEVGGAQAPDPAGEVDVVRVVDLRQVVERARHLRERKRVPAALVLDLDEPLLDVDVRGPVLTHGAELDQVTVGHLVADREQQLEGSDHVRVLGLDGGRAGLHRVGRRGLLAVVDDRLGQGLGDHPVEEVAVLDRPDEGADLLAAHLVPGLDAIVQRADRGQRAGRVLDVPAPPGEVVDDGDLVAASRESHRGRPPEIPVAPQDQDPHAPRVRRRGFGRASGRRLSCTGP